jgi:glycosyltransferase involved in cell wall biosynthesis
MIKALIDMHRLKHHRYNGLYTYSEGLGKSLASSPQQDFEFYFYLDRPNFGFFGNDVKYVEHRSVDKFYKPGTSRFDVWHITTTLSWYRPFNRKTKTVFTLHDLGFLIEEKENFRRNKRLVSEIQKRVDRADHIVGISKFSLAFASDYLRLDHKPASVIYNGCNKIQVQGFNNPVYRPTRPFLFSIGLIQPRKSFHLLPALLKDNDYELVIAGLDTFDYRKKIEEEIKRWKVEDRVKITGPVSEEDKFWYYKNCEAFLFPSVAEGFGLPVIEAMQFGKPVFISTKTCMPEIGGNVAYYFHSLDPESMQDTFAKGMQHYATTHPAQAIKQHAAIFNWDKAADEYMDVYRNLV